MTPGLITFANYDFSKTAVWISYDKNMFNYAKKVSKHSYQKRDTQQSPERFFLAR